MQIGLSAQQYRTRVPSSPAIRHAIAIGHSGNEPARASAGSADFEARDIPRTNRGERALHVLEPDEDVVAGTRSRADPTGPEGASASQ